MASACMSISYVKQVVCTPTPVLASRSPLCRFPGSASSSSLPSKTNFPSLCSRKVQGHPAFAFNPSEFEPFTVEELEAKLPESNYKPFSRVDDKKSTSVAETSMQDSQPSEYKPFSFDELEQRAPPRTSYKSPKQKHKTVSTTFQPLGPEYPPITLEELEAKIAASNYKPFSRFESKADASSDKPLGSEYKPFTIEELEQKIGDSSHKSFSKKANTPVASSPLLSDSEYKPFTVEELEQKIGESSFGSFSSTKSKGEVKSADTSFKAFSGEEFGQTNVPFANEAEGQSPSVDPSLSSEKSETSSEPIFSEVEPPKLTKLYVGNIPWNYENQQLEDLFKQYGSVFVAEVVLDRPTGRSRGFGFVYMNSPEEAEVAIKNLDGKAIAGRDIRVSYQETAEERSERLAKGSYGEGISNIHKLFVANLPWSVDDVTLGRLFDEYGTVVQARVVTDRETGRSRGFGFVTLSSNDEVNNAIASLNGSDYAGRPLKVALASDRSTSRSPLY